MKTRNPWHGGIEGMKEETWDEKWVVLITKKIYEMHEQKVNLFAIKGFEESMDP